MPRPGPRPYECVRRAWHSDRHQPIRGSLIQEIFRVVNEVHSSSTKKNKEWQEKLPVVVLKAEEIMYSKANSEAEYMDLNTLWDRSNDAINTIIRLDESTETGDLLQPCIEAALSLGCTPRRTSRSQRNCHPRCYLIPGTQDPNHFFPNSIVDPSSITNPQCIPKFPNILKPPTLSATHHGSQLRTLVCQNTSVSPYKFPFPTDNWHLSSYNWRLPVKSSSFCSGYPLYYGTCLESWNVPDSIPGASNTAARVNQTEIKDCLLDQQGIGCDLSLRLGSLSTPSPNVSNRQLGNVNNLVPENDKEFTFIANPRGHARIDTSMKKRKADFTHFTDELACSRKLKLQCSEFR